MTLRSSEPLAGEILSTMRIRPTNRLAMKLSIGTGSFSITASISASSMPWPLGLDAFKAKLGAPRKKPACVERWMNFYDPSDFVALGKPLDENNFASNIDNDGSVDNRTLNSHGIVGYLPHNGVIDALKHVL